MIMRRRLRSCFPRCGLLTRAAWCGVWVGILLLLTPSVRAAEPFLEMVQGLRGRGLYDYALYYLDQMEASPRTTPENKALIPFERGITLRDGARQIVLAERQLKQLDAAAAAFDEFARANAKHPLAGRANSERAQILVEKAKVKIWEAQSESDATVIEGLRGEAKELLLQARQVYDTSVAQHKTVFESFPGFIPEDQRQARDERSAAEREYMLARLNRAQTFYWEAQTYDRKQPLREKILTDASLEFEALHTEYRSLVAGLFARLWQGKCFEEMDRLGEAIGIYGELIKHPGDNPAMMDLKSRARHFMFICYNHESQKKYRLVNQEAAAWLADRENRLMKSRETGRGIEWEQARSMEFLALDPETDETERIVAFRTALDVARRLARLQGELQAPAAAMVARIEDKLGRNVGDPIDFNSAYSRADELFQQAQSFAIKVNELQAQGKQLESDQMKSAMKTTAADATRLMTIGLRLAKANENPPLVERAQMLVAVGYNYQEEYYRSAAMAEWFIRAHADDNPDKLKTMGSVALSSLYNAYLAADPENRQWELNQILTLAQSLTRQFPGTELAVDSSIAAGGMFIEAGDPLQAAKSFEEVPKSSSRYPEAQLKAGIAYLAHFDSMASLDDALRPESAKLEEWKSAASEHLQIGVDEESKRTPADASAPADLIRGRLALARVRNLEGIYKTTDGKVGAIELLTTEPHSPLKAVQIDPGSERPDDPASLQSKGYASETYQLLLRAYIGVNNLEAASDAKSRLEELVDASQAGELTQLYVGFGKQLEQELQQLRAAGDQQRLDQVQTAFEGFLQQMLNGASDGQTFGSLLWIATTFTSLGEGSEQGGAKAKGYYAQASTAYELILKKATADPAFAGAATNITAVQVRLVKTKVRQGDYEGADAALQRALADPKVASAPNIQFQACELYTAWGDEGDTEKYSLAIKGTPKGTVPALWGWVDLAKRTRGQRGNPEMLRIFLDSNYYYLHSLLQMGKRETDAKKRAETLESAKQNTETFARTTKIPAEDVQRLDVLYAKILSEMGQPVVSIATFMSGNQEINASVDGTGNTTGTGTSTAGTSTGTPTAENPDETPPAEGPSTTGNFLIMIVLLVLTVGAVWGIFMMATNQSKKRRAQRLAEIASAPKKTKRPTKPTPSGP
ncbi:MAG: hypothetical protein R3C01_06220 [Planctomycetaceae bacterium]